MHQKRSFSRRNVWIAERVCASQTRIVLSSLLETKMSFVFEKATHETLLKWPRRVSISQALESLIRQSFTTRSSATEATSGCVGWKQAQFTPRSCPSITCFTLASFDPKTSTAETPPPPIESVFSRRDPVSHTRTVWSREDDTMRSSLGWKSALIT